MGKLVLTRYEGEGVVISVGDVRIHVLVSQVRGTRVRLAFDAPLNVDIHRDEIQKQVDAGEESDG